MQIKPKEIIQMYVCCRENASLTACTLHIHRSTVYRWVARARYCGGIHINKLQRQSTRPHAISYALTHHEQSAIISLREQRGYAAQKIKKILGLFVHVNTIHRFLKRNQLIHRVKNHRRPYSQKTIHMHLKNTQTVGYLQMDVKYLTPELTGLPWTCYEYAVIDIYSRYKEVVIKNHRDEDASIESLIEIIPKLPFKPCFLQTDNGLEFQRRFHAHVEALGIRHHHIHKSTPNENAVIERSFRTDEEEFFFLQYKGASQYDDLRVQFADYIREYNEKRPHLGISLKYPLQVVRESLSQMS